MLPAHRPGKGDGKFARQLCGASASKLLPGSLETRVLICAQDNRRAEFDHTLAIEDCQGEAGVCAANVCSDDLLHISSCLPADTSASVNRLSHHMTSSVVILANMACQRRIRSSRDMASAVRIASAISSAL